MQQLQRDEPERRPRRRRPPPESPPRKQGGLGLPLLVGALVTLAVAVPAIVLSTAKLNQDRAARDKRQQRDRLKSSKPRPGSDVPGRQAQRGASPGGPAAGTGSAGVGAVTGLGSTPEAQELRYSAPGDGGGYRDAAHGSRGASHGEGGQAAGQKAVPPAQARQLWLQPQCTLRLPPQVVPTLTRVTSSTCQKQGAVASSRGWRPCGWWPHSCSLPACLALPPPPRHSSRSRRLSVRRSTRRPRRRSWPWRRSGRKA